MLVSHCHRFIYTKTAKTASTSVESYFERYCLPKGSWTFSHGRDEYEGPEGIVGYRGPSLGRKKWRDHMSAEDIRRQVGESIWSSYFKFCVIRNPFERLVSGFHWLQWRQQKLPKPTWKDRLGQRMLGTRDLMSRVQGDDAVTRFRSWLSLGGDLPDRDKYLIDGNLCVDYLIRYESLADGMQHVCKTIGVPFEPNRLPTLKMGLRDNDLPLAAYYDPDSVRIIEQRYDFELQTFGYTAPSV